MNRTLLWVVAALVTVIPWTPSRADRLLRLDGTVLEGKVTVLSATLVEVRAKSRTYYLSASDVAEEERERLFGARETPVAPSVSRASRSSGPSSDVEPARPQASRGSYKPTAAQQLNRVLEQGDDGAAADVLARHPELAGSETIAKVLDHAAAKGMTRTVECLLARDVDPDQAVRYGWRPIHRAAEAGHDKVVAVLIAAGADVSAQNDWGKAPLHVAAEGAHLESARLLLAAGVDINVRDAGNAAPLHYAAASGSAPMVRLLLDHGAYGRIRDEGDSTAIHYAATTGSVAVAEALLPLGLDVGAFAVGKTPLHLVVEHVDAPDFVGWLLEQGAKINARTGKFTSGVSNTEGLKTALQLAGQYGRVDTATLLIEAGADVQAEDRKGMTALHHAVRGAAGGWKGAPEVMDLLLENGAKVQAVDQEGNTPLHQALSSAMSFKRLDVVRRLMAAGAEVNRANRRGETPLHLAAANSTPEVVRILLKAGADEDAVTFAGRTPYDLASKRKNPEMIGLLYHVR